MTNKLRLTVLVVAVFLSGALVGVAHSQKPPQKPAAKPAQNLPAFEKHIGNLDVGGAKIYYEECGAGAAVVLLHDGLLHSVTWDGMWERLCRKYHAIRYDRRGYGKSDLPKEQFSPT